MRSGVIKVVVHDKEGLFLSPDGIMLDRLDAFDFYSGNISIARGGVEIDSAEVVADGDKDPLPTFVGLKIVFADCPERLFDCHELYPGDFLEGDEIRFANTYWDVEFRQMYIEDEVAIKLSDILKSALEIKDREKRYKAADKYSTLFEKEVESFVFPKNPILRRRGVGKNDVDWYN